MNTFAAIVLSAGSGKRMNSDIPKQYMSLGDYPVIYYSLKAFQESPVDEIILVCGKDDIDFCKKEIVEKYQLTKVTQIVAGGAERYDSVYEGINATSADYVLIHDGARPVLTQDIISRSMDCVQETKACVAAMPVKDTIKLADENKDVASTPDRNLLWQIQTPQSFENVLLKEAYAILKRDMEMGKNIPSITDDAMIIEYAIKRRVRLVEGAYTNVKVTTPEDLSVAEIFLKKLEITC